MTGKEIAANLRGSKLPWGRGRLYNPDTKAFCALGIKLHERGFTEGELSHVGEGMVVNTPQDYDTKICELTSLNDNAASKEKLIATLEGPKYATVDYPIDNYAAYYRRLYPNGSV